jgi:hypothetical protein
MVTQRSRQKGSPRGKRLRIKVIPPPKSVEELAREQGVLGKHPDYVALATGVWPTKADIVAFEKHLREIRNKKSH